MRRTVNVKRMLFDTYRKPTVKEHKKPIETKEEKFIPETKVIPDEVLSIKKLTEAISGYTDAQINEIIEKDERVSAKKLAEKELKRREG